MIADRPATPGDATRGGVASRTAVDQAHAERRPDHSGDPTVGGHCLREFFQVGCVRAADRVGSQTASAHESRPAVGGDDRQIHQAGECDLASSADDTSNIRALVHDQLATVGRGNDNGTHMMCYAICSNEATAGNA